MECVKMVYIKGKQYNFHYKHIAVSGIDKGKIVEGDIKLKFDYESKKDFIFNCDHCDKDITHIFWFIDDKGGIWHFGSECVKKMYQ
jgi:hypothetical protein